VRQNPGGWVVNLSQNPSDTVGEVGSDRKSAPLRPNKLHICFNRVPFPVRQQYLRRFWHTNSQLPNPCKNRGFECDFRHPFMVTLKTSLPLTPPYDTLEHPLRRVILFFLLGFLSFHLRKFEPRSLEFKQLRRIQGQRLVPIRTVDTAWV
jgi:hypothetical protein